MGCTAAVTGTGSLAALLQRLDAESTVRATPRSLPTDTIEHAIRALYGASLQTMFNAPGIPKEFGGNGGDSRTPDIIVQPNVGVTYTSSSKKQAEHGSFAHDDTNVMLLVSKPGLPAGEITSFVETTQVAPTILQALGLDPGRLDAVRAEGTPVLPGLNFK
jgi:hypothetical protein